MPQYSKKDRDGVAELRKNCADLLNEAPAFPECVGTRKLIRFLVGHEYNIPKATEMVRKYLEWRRVNGVDQIRQNIIFGGMDHPTKFPMAEIILKLMPCLAISHEACDKTGAPICVDQYNFDPSEVLEKIGVQNYYKFFIHVLEFRSIILEQLSEARDRAYLAGLPDDESRALAEYIPPYVEDGSGNLVPVQAEAQPWGTILGTLVVRDLSGIGFRHLGSTGQEIIKMMVSVSSDNYPEMLRKCLIVNSPWIFTSVWYLIKGWVAAKTAAKVSLVGGSFMELLREEIVEENIPVMLGGTCAVNSSLVYEPYAFDLAYFDVPYLGSTEAQKNDAKAANIAVAVATAKTTAEDVTPPSAGDA